MSATRLTDLDPRSTVNGVARRSPIGLLLHAIVAGALASAWIYVSRRYRLSMTVLLIPQLAVGYIVAVLAHESGHAAAAILQGFHVSAFAVWPVRIYRDAGGWRVGWLTGRRGFISIGAGGARHLLREFVVVAAGPFTSALIAIASWITLGAMGGQAKWILDQLLIVGLWSALTAAGGLLPLGNGSDGIRLRLLLRSGRASQVHSLLGQGRIDDAERLLVWLLRQPWPEAEHARWCLEAARFAACYREDLTTAHKWFDAGKQSGPPDDLTRTETALAMLRDRIPRE